MPKADNLRAAAGQIAEAAHAGQLDNAGQPYIEHPRRVAARVPDRLKPVALLHDVVEDTHVTFDDLRRTFPDWIVAAVEALTHRSGETRAAYYARVAANPDAVVVKLADIDDNTDPDRLAALDEPTRTRLVARYAFASAELTRRQRTRAV